MTSYLVLQQAAAEPANQASSGGGRAGGWFQVGPAVESVSAEAAIRKVVTDKSGTYVAVPLRSWSPITVTVETKRTLKLTENGKP